MEVIHFKVKGLVNSFRRVETATYNNTELTPKKTHIAGLLTNVSGFNEDFYYELLPKIKVGVIPVRLENYFVDLWQYKKWKSGNKGVAVLKREKLYKPEYEIYLQLPSEHMDHIFSSLKKPKRTPSLGMDDEMIEIKEVEIVNINRYDTSKLSIHSVFPEDLVRNCTFKINAQKNMVIIPPRTVITNLSFEKGPPRIPRETLRIVEFFGGYCEGEINENADNIFTHNEKHVVMW